MPNRKEMKLKEEYEMTINYYFVSVKMYGEHSQQTKNASRAAKRAEGHYMNEVLKKYDTSMKRMQYGTIFDYLYFEEKQNKLNEK